MLVVHTHIRGKVQPPVKPLLCSTKNVEDEKKKKRRGGKRWKEWENEASTNRGCRSEVCEGLITKILFQFSCSVKCLSVPHSTPSLCPPAQDIQPQLHRSQAGNNKRRGTGEEGRHRKGPLACSQGTEEP